MGGRRTLSAALVAGLLALLLVLIAIPLTVVGSYIPPAVTKHKPLWIALFAAGAVAIVVLTVLSSRRSGQKAKPQLAADPVVVGEIRGSRQRS